MEVGDCKSSESGLAKFYKGIKYSMFNCISGSMTFIYLFYILRLYSTSAEGL